MGTTKYQVGVGFHFGEIHTLLPFAVGFEHFHALCGFIYIDYVKVVIGADSNGYSVCILFHRYPVRTGGLAAELVGKHFLRIDENSYACQGVGVARGEYYDKQHGNRKHDDAVNYQVKEPKALVLFLLVLSF